MFDRGGQKIPATTATKSLTQVFFVQNWINTHTVSGQKWQWIKCAIKPIMAVSIMSFFGLWRQSRGTLVDASAICMEWCHHWITQAVDKVPWPAEDDTDIMAWPVVRMLAGMSGETVKCVVAVGTLTHTQTHTQTDRHVVLEWWQGWVTFEVILGVGHDDYLSQGTVELFIKKRLWRTADYTRGLCGLTVLYW